MPSVASPREKKPRVQDSSRIRVVVRKRPLSQREQEASRYDIVEMRDTTDAPNLTINEAKLKVDMTAYTEPHHFQFDAVGVTPFDALLRALVRRGLGLGVQ